MKKIYRIFFARFPFRGLGGVILAPLIFLFPAGTAFAGVEMADALRASGKIYVVVAVLCLIFAGLIFYLIRIDRKVSGIEKKLKEKESS
ncbi:MAG: CcmD family protein [Bacteroidetes bacterium]|nr:CcmD family protein [Bacteroidota bacterium]